MRHLVYPVAGIFLLWAGYQVLADTYISDNNGQILVVYNADTALQDCSSLTADVENLSEQALAGVCQAYRDQQKQGRAPTLQFLNVHDSVEDGQTLNAGGVYEQLSARVAHGSLLGIVSVLTSPDSQPVVRFCRSMQIPLLLALAANNDLLSPVEDTNGLVFRMMPTNREQALDIAMWLQKRKFARVALFHEPNSFGEYLHRQVNNNLKTADYSPVVYQFEVREQMEFADLMPQLLCDRIDAIVYLGFASRATDLIDKLKWYQGDKSNKRCEAKSQSFDGLAVLLSSGAYQEDFNDEDKFKFPFTAYAMLPTKPFQVRSSNADRRHPITDVTELASAMQYGYDSYRLMSRLAGTAKGKGSDALRQIFSDPPLDSRTGHDYQFDDRGELKPVDKNKYQVYRLASSRPEPSERGNR